MALPLNLVVIPMLAGLAAGGGTLASYVGGSTPAAPVEMAAPVVRPCSTQTWPYLDHKCLTQNPQAQAPQRPVRLVMAPRTDDSDATGATVPQASPAEPEPSGLTSSSAVLYQPNATTPTLSVKPRTKRVARTAQVPSESRSGSNPRIVVRPLRLGDFR